MVLEQMLDDPRKPWLNGQAQGGVSQAHLDKGCRGHNG